MFRLINDALDSGLQPSILIFSQVKLLKEIPTQNIGKFINLLVTSFQTLSK